jgi:signal transduction histidine kinase
MPLSDLFGDESVHSPVLDAHYNALGGHSQSFEIDVGGSLFWGTVEPLFNADWNLIGTVGSAAEITSRHDAEVERTRQLTCRHEIDKRQALMDLATGTTQHFGRLFNSVSAYAAIIGMGLPTGHPALRWLDNIEKAAQCAVDLAGQLVSSGTPISHHEEPVHFSELVNRQLEIYQALLSKKTTFQFDLETEKAEIHADPEDVRRLLVNLLFNASTAIGDDEGTVSLRTQVTKGPPWPLFDQDADNDLPEGDYLWLQVSDTGHGLDEVGRARVFEPFAGFTGRGIGMGAALAIVSRMHGTVSISSKPGLGTTCHVFLPIVPRSAAVPPAPECFF